MSENVLFYAQIAFWVLLFLIVHCYLLFPMTLPFVSEIFKRKKKKAEGIPELPTVSILISAYNEEAVIERKIHNILEIDYPKEMARIQKEMKDLMQREKESQRMLEEAFKGIGYGIE